MKRLKLIILFTCAFMLNCEYSMASDSEIDDILFDTPSYTYSTVSKPAEELHAKRIPEEGTVVDLEKINRPINFGNLLQQITYAAEDATEIILKSNKISLSDIIDIGAQIGSFKKLESLDLDDNNIADTGLYVLLVKALEHPALRYISLRNNTIDLGLNKARDFSFDEPSKGKKITVYLGKSDSGKVSKECIGNISFKVSS